MKPIHFLGSPPYEHPKEHILVEKSIFKMAPPDVAFPNLTGRPLRRPYTIDLAISHFVHKIFGNPVTLNYHWIIL